MIVYIPQRIETAKQAEQLPIGTVSMPDHPEDLPAIKITEQSWVCVWDVDDYHDATYDVASNGHMIGSTVLVPIEAEEGADTIQAGVGSFYTRSRFVTPWEES